MLHAELRNGHADRERVHVAVEGRRVASGQRDPHVDGRDGRAHAVELHAVARKGAQGRDVVVGDFEHERPAVGALPLSGRRREAGALGHDTEDAIQRAGHEPAHGEEELKLQDGRAAVAVSDGAHDGSTRRGVSPMRARRSRVTAVYRGVISMT